ncbi:hypothetical protein B0T24DRAFT_598336 [Lasiosphaeria ovina]|uniref:Uncharacterized protein n=1 Tax=Lasiosphaeria ovina TaxID=92902 RepID=A0AAE0JVF5_9PEZI|nr:hypothetical protein B0T24DRAFT_598336 [Lasiosphaeria ovina]
MAGTDQAVIGPVSIFNGIAGHLGRVCPTGSSMPEPEATDTTESICVSVGEYAWLTELQLLDYSTDEIADELLEKARDGPWIFSEINVPNNIVTFTHDFHIPGCVHSETAASREGLVDSAARPLSSNNGASLVQDMDGVEYSVRECIDYFYGLGGVGPLTHGFHGLRFGTVNFEQDNSTAIVSLADPESASDVLKEVEKAAAVLQQVGGASPRESRASAKSAKSATPSPEIRRLLEFLCPEMLLADWQQGERFLDSLVAQFVSLAFLSYSQGHCGPLRPFFPDTLPERILLIGDNRWSANFKGPCILGSLVDLSCFGDMLQQPVFTFQYLDQATALSLPNERPRLDLKASPEDLLDTWGPGEFITPTHDMDNLYAISLGGGLIMPTSKAKDAVLHWSRASKLDTLSASTFPRREKLIVGARVSANHKCEAGPQRQLRMACSLLEEMGTFPGYWEVSERQLGIGLQAGQSSIALLQFNQTWVKRQGLTRKAKMLARRSLYVSDLEGPFGVQISVCTGIARRVRLRDLLADVLPKTLVEDFDLLGILREGDLRAWLENLEHALQKAFESLAIAVLFLLQDTGMDRKGQDLIIGCIQPDLPFQCFRIPCRRENYWARMIADSEDIATFAYMTTRCLETDKVKCRGSDASWANSTALFWTAVSCCQESHGLPAAQGGNLTPSSVQWTLKHSEAYLIGRVDAPLRRYLCKWTGRTTSKNHSYSSR